MDTKFVTANEGARRGDYVLMTVEDTGIGISTSIQEHIFEPFFTTKAKGLGTGLGLATVYGIVKQYGGYVTVHSEVDQGSTFYIYLPVAATPERPGEIQAQPQIVPTGIGTILIAEDNEPVREMAARVLRGQGYTVLEGADGLEALRVANEYAGPIHVLLADVVMPALNGRQLADQVSTRRPELQVIYMSGYTDTSLLPEEVLAADTDLLQKPFTAQTLLAKVHDVLTSRSRRSSES